MFLTSYRLEDTTAASSDGFFYRVDALSTPAAARRWDGLARKRLAPCADVAISYRRSRFAP